MHRAFSVLEVKAVDDDAREIEGMATTPTPDRMGDIVEPLGIKFRNPMPLLHQHKSDAPVGTVRFDKPTEEGVRFRARLPKIADPGPLKDRVDTAWGEIKAGLVRAVSIGFRSIEQSIMESGGFRFLKSEVLELSLVTIPAQAEATITTIRSIDAELRAATGREQRVDEPNLPGASGKTHPIKLRPKEGKSMTKIADQIRAFEAKRAASEAAMEDIMAKAADDGETLDTEESERYDALETEVKQIDEHLHRLRGLEAIQAAKAKPVEGVTDAASGSTVRAGLAPVRVKKQELPGVRMARLAKVKTIARLDNERPLDVAERMYGADSEVVALIKGPVVAGSNLEGNWAAALTGTETSAFADFVEFLRPATILGQFGTGNIPSLLTVGFRERLVSQTGAGAGYWVGEGKPKPLTAFDFAGTSMEPMKVANIAVLTEENIRSSNPNSEVIVRNALAAALVAEMDTAFIDPANDGTVNVKPASITFGADSIVAQTWTDADDVRLDIRAVFQKFIDADNPPENGVWIMSTTNALAASMATNALGQPEFQGITMRGGTFEGMPVIASRYAGDNVILVNASDIYVADEGGISVDMSREASVEMLDANLVQDSTAGTGASLVSLWQSNLVGLRAERTINWMRRRSSAVAYLTGVNWGGTVPAS